MGGRGSSSGRGGSGGGAGGGGSSGGGSGGGGASKQADVHSVTNEDRNAFKAAFVNLDKGRLFVPITELRQKLSQWPREKFDTVLEKIWHEEVIHLHPADRSRMTEAEWADTFVDSNGFHMRRVTWNKF